MGGDQPKQAWPQHDASHHLAHYLRLPQAREDRPHQPAEGKDYPGLHDQQKTDLVPGIGCVP